MKKIVLRFGLLALALVVLMQLSKYWIVSRALGTELMLGALAVLFIGLGILLSRYLFRSKQSGSLNGEIDPKEVKRLGISPREYQVLQQMAYGKSNLEIAETLFISENTVKTHVSNLLVKLEAKRRTEAVSIARKLRVL